MKISSLALCLAMAACADLSSDEIEQEAHGGGGGGGGGQPDPYLQFLDELAQPGIFPETNIRAGMVDPRAFWTTGNPIPGSITIAPIGRPEATVGAGFFTYPLGESHQTKPTGYQAPLSFNFPRSAIGTSFVVKGTTTNSRGTVTLSKTVTVVDAPSVPSGVTITKVGAQLVVQWAPSHFGVGPIHYIVEDLTCVVPRQCSGVVVADTTATSVTFTRTHLTLRIRAVASNADSNLFEQDISRL